jgi:hypothetical protein
LSNSTDVTFPTATGNWNSSANITHFAIFDAPSGGNMIVHADLNTAKAVLNGDTARFTSGSIVTTLD